MCVREEGHHFSSVLLEWQHIIALNSDKKGVYIPKYHRLLWIIQEKMKVNVVNSKNMDDDDDND